MSNSIFELRDSTAARRFVAQGLSLARNGPLTAEKIERGLDWAHRLASEGKPLPAVGFVADIGWAAASMANDRLIDANTSQVDESLFRRYEDYVVGKIAADLSFERAIDAAAVYQDDQREKAISFIIACVCERAQVGGAWLSPAVIKSLINSDPEEWLPETQNEIEQHGLDPLLREHWRRLITQVRNTGNLVGKEDLFELQSGSALVGFAQRVALRQTLQAAEQIGETLPAYKVRPRPSRRQVATRIFDEDTYPVGGFTSISNRGSVESLLHSQLAFMEPDERPDLFDAKYLRQELLYYSRDENQFWRKRVRLIFVLSDDLVAARVKDEQASFQRIILLLGLIKTHVDKLTEWLSEEALGFDFVFVKEGAASLLTDELEILNRLFGHQQETGVAEFHACSRSQFAALVKQRTERNECHLLAAGMKLTPLPEDLTTAFQLLLTHAQPQLWRDEEAIPADNADLVIDVWRWAALHMLEFWV